MGSRREWSIKDLLEWTTRFFSQKAVEAPRLEAEVLLAHVLGKSRIYLYANYHAPVNQLERTNFKKYIKRRINGEPVAYITGSKEFMSLEFQVTPDVLIPRPESELLVETVVDLAKKNATNRICDVGTGSGAIAISIAVYLPGADIYAVDLSASALQIAQQNAQKHNVDIKFFEGNLLCPLLNEGPFDFIVANLPYIPDVEYQELSIGIKEYEPAMALKALGDGLDTYRQLIVQTDRLLKPEGYLIFEIGHNQGGQAAQLVSGFYEYEIIKDINGHDRLVKARKGA